MGWVNTGKGRHAWRSVATLLIRSAFTKRHNFLFREVCHIIHAYSVARSRRSHHLRSWGKNVTLVGSHFTASWAIKKLGLLAGTYSTFT